MSTRNLTMVIHRDYAQNHEAGFAQNPTQLSDSSCVNMYLHHDGYPEWRGVELALWVKSNSFQDGTRMAAKLVADMYYDSCYLYPEPDQIDHEYTYVIWTGDRDDIWISCYNQYSSECVFVLKPDKVIERYSHKRFEDSYTDYKQEDK